VKNLDSVDLSDEAKEKLSKNGFVVTGPVGGSMPDLYSWGDLPFITIDSVIEVYLSELELAWSELEDKQATRFVQLQTEIWEALAERIDSLPESTRPAAARAIGLVSVARSLGDPKWQLPISLPGDDKLGSVRKEVLLDIERGKNASGFAQSELWDREIDWSIFKPTGPYSVSEKLSGFYRLSQWRSRLGFRVENKEERLCAAILMSTLVASTPRESWPKTGPLSLLYQIEQTYRPFVGKAADAHFSNLPIISFFYNQANTLPQSIGSDEFDAKLLKLLNSIVQPESQAEWGTDSRRLVLLTTRVTLPSRVYGETTGPNRTLPSTLDLMAVAGCQRARELTLQNVSDLQRPWLSAKLDDLQKDVVKTDDQLGISGIQASLRCLCRDISVPHADSRQPLFMQTPAYRDRQLSAAMATWTGAREIYGLRVDWDVRAGGISEPPPGLVEPNLDAWQRLIELAVETNNSFARHDIQPGPTTLYLALRFRKIAEKQLRGETLTRADRNDFRLYDLRLSNSIDIKVAPDSSDVDRRVTVPIGNSKNPNLTRFAGKVCQPIYVVYEKDGQLHLLHGGVFGYREFDLAAGKALNRKDFISLMDSNDAPPSQDWTKSYSAE
jgi:hypothetical protein